MDVFLICMYISNPEPIYSCYNICQQRNWPIYPTVQLTFIAWASPASRASLTIIFTLSLQVFFPLQLSLSRMKISGARDFLLEIF